MRLLRELWTADCDMYSTVLKKGKWLAKKCMRLSKHEKKQNLLFHELHKLLEKQNMCIKIKGSS